MLIRPTLLFFFLGANVAFCADIELKISELPTKISDLVAKEFASAKIIGAGKRTIKGELKGWDVTLQSDKMTFDAYFTPDGEIECTGKTIKLKHVPDKVRKAVESRYPHGTLSSAEVCSDFKTKLKFYSIEVVRGTTSIEVDISEEGEFRKEEDTTD